MKLKKFNIKNGYNFFLSKLLKFYYNKKEKS